MAPHCSIHSHGKWAMLVIIRGYTRSDLQLLEVVLRLGPGCPRHGPRHATPAWGPKPEPLMLVKPYENQRNMMKTIGKP